MATYQPQLLSTWISSAGKFTALSRTRIVLQMKKQQFLQEACSKLSPIHIFPFSALVFFYGSIAFCPFKEG